MMGDDMAIRSGGMYGNPESSYTRAMPSSGVSVSGFHPVSRFVKAGINANLQWNAVNAQYVSDFNQAQLNLQALRKERDYNLENYQQYISDTLAKNKMSFYASGLDLSGTAMDVTMANKAALEKDMGVMNYNYNVKEKTIQNEIKAIKEKHKAGQRQVLADFVTSIF